MVGKGVGMAGGGRRRERGCCTVNFLKYLLFIFNFIFLVGGAAVLGVGVWTVVARFEWVPLLATPTYAASAHLLLTAGVVALMAAALACCALVRNHRCCLLMYTFLVAVVLVVEATAGVMAYLYEDQVEGQLALSLADTFTAHYGIEPDVTHAVDSLQLKLKCCGAVTFSEWRDSVWLRDSPGLNNTVPDSCCKSPSPYCGVRDHPSNIWYNGCIHRLSEEVSQHLLVMGAVGCGLSLLQVPGVLLSCCLYIKLRRIHDPYY